MQSGKLTFIGLGLFDETDMSLKAKKTLQSADIIFAEFYTSTLMGTNIEQLEQIIGKKINVLSRKETEQETAIIDAAKTKKICFLTGGDSLTATTHVDLRVQAVKNGIETTVIHGTSIISAVPGLLGLQHYKFGRTTTLAYPEGDYFPTSPYDVILSNQQNKLHTLILLDIQAEKNRFMTASEAIQLLIRMEEKKNKQLITDDTIIAVVGQAGSAQPLVKADTLNQMKTVDFGPPLQSMVIPANLHFMEIEALQILADLPTSIAEKLQKI
ncbi:MAG: diphthine synthase [Thermoplasmatota archaeon]